MKGIKDMPCLDLLQLALLCANASAESYTRQTVVIPTTGAACLVVDAPEHTIIAFRGTQDFRDARVDAESWRQDDLHYGFRRDYLSIEKSLIRLLTASFKPVLLTGHSLGGALAALAYYQVEAGTIAGCLTFGQPRFCGRAFASFPRYASASLRENHSRFVLDLDIVPRLPGYLAGFRHLGTEYFFPGRAGLVVNPSLPSKLWCDLKSLWREYTLREIEQLREHHIQRYIARIGQEISALAGGTPPVAAASATHTVSPTPAASPAPSL
jgi:hypothetical protein